MRSMLFVLAIAFQCAAFADQERAAAVMIFFYSDHELQPSPAERLFSMFKKRLENRAKLTDFFLVRARNVQELSLELNSLNLPENEKITKLYMTSHGTSASTLVKTNAKEIIQIGLGPNATPIFIAAFADQLSGLDIWPTDVRTEAALAAFAPLRLKLASRCDVFCDACYILSGSEREARAKVQLLANLFGVRDGRIYGNSAQGHMSMVPFIPFWEHASKRSRMVAATFQGILVSSVVGGIFVNPTLFIPAISFPAFQAIARFARDRGYEFEFRDGQPTRGFKTRAVSFANKFFEKRSCSERLLGGIHPLVWRKKFLTFVRWKWPNAIEFFAQKTRFLAALHSHQACVAQFFTAGRFLSDRLVALNICRKG